MSSSKQAIVIRPPGPKPNKLELNEIQGIKLPIYLPIPPYEFEKVKLPEREKFDEKIESNRIRVEVLKTSSPEDFQVQRVRH